MQRGPLLNPCAQQNSFCQGRLALIRPAVFSRSVFAGLSTGRLAHSHCLSFVGLITFSLVPLHRRSKPTLWAGFPLGVCSAKASLLSQGEAPLKARFPLGGYASPLFPKAVTVSCLLLRRGRNRASPEFQPISVVGWFTPEPSPTKTRARILARVFSGPSSSVPTNSLSSAANLRQRTR